MTPHINVNKSAVSTTKYYEYVSKGFLTCSFDLANQIGRRTLIRMPLTSFDYHCFNLLWKGFVLVTSLLCWSHTRHTYSGRTKILCFGLKKFTTIFPSNSSSTMVVDCHDIIISIGGSFYNIMGKVASHATIVFAGWPTVVFLLYIILFMYFLISHICFF
jgi:hypothetical protein